MKLGKFSFKIVSTDANARRIAIIPGNFPVLGLSGADWAHRKVHYHDVTALTSAGVVVDFVLDDGYIDSNSKVKGEAVNSKYSIQHFLHYIKQRPQRCSEIVIQADNTDVFDTMLTYSESTPLKGSEDYDIPLSDYFSTGQFQDNKIVMPVNMILSDKTLLLMTVPGGGRTIRVSFNKLVNL